MVQSTKAIILRTTKYGETSLIVSAFTEKFGLQQYIVKGIRSAKKTGTVAPGHLQVGNLLELIVQHNEKNSLQYIKEARQTVFYDHLFSDVIKNAILSFMIELVQKCIKQPDPSPELFQFLEDIFLGLDRATPYEAANIPIFFCLHLAHFFGFRLLDTYSEQFPIIDLREGQFIQSLPGHEHVVQEPESGYIAHLLRVMQLEELATIQLNRTMRNKLIDYCLEFYALHIQPFGAMRSLPVVRSLLDS